MSDDWRSLRLVAWAVLIREVGFLVEGEEENESYLVVAWSFVGLSDVEVEGSKVDESDVPGGCARVRAPTVVA